MSSPRSRASPSRSSPAPSRADHRDEVGRRGDGDRPHLPRIAAEGACASLETGLTGFDEIADPGDGAADRPDRQAALAQADARPPAGHRPGLAPRPDRSTRSTRACRYDPWFLARDPARSSTPRREVRADGLPTSADGAARLKTMGFSDARLAKLTGETEARGRRAAPRRSASRRSSSASTPAPPSSTPQTPYMYSTYEAAAFGDAGMRGRPDRPQEGRHPRRRAEPHRPGHRVRLLLRPRLPTR